jgi:hypothetical protein
MAGWAGVEFIAENGGGQGVRLRKRQRPKKSKKSEGQGGAVAITAMTMRSQAGRLCKEGAELFAPPEIYHQ